MINGLPDQFDLLLMIDRRREIIDLDEVYAPFSIQFEYGVVIFLGAGTIRDDCIIVFQPLTLIFGRIDLVGSDPVCSFYRKPVFHGNFRNTAHDMDPEFQSLVVHIICQLPEPAAAIS